MASLFNGVALINFLAHGTRRFSAVASDGIACRRRCKAKDSATDHIKQAPGSDEQDATSEVASTAVPSEASRPSTPTASDFGEAGEFSDEVENLIGGLGSLRVSDSFATLLEWADDEDEPLQRMTSAVLEADDDEA
mmetsp:Transcript_74116/g.194394  ORF Transcript_74116/g.194394 Transcript_74116/m.194394 type:complete len:136 (+) Transcript_74116:135-542(+)